MTKREAAIISAYSGVLIGKFEDMNEYIEEKLGRPLYTHELASKSFVNEIKAKSKKDLLGIVIEEEEECQNIKKLIRTKW